MSKRITVNVKCRRLVDNLTPLSVQCCSCNHRYVSCAQSSERFAEKGLGTRLGLVRCFNNDSYSCAVPCIQCYGSRLDVSVHET